ncbi:MAG: outer membrane beta-barrel protein [Legionellales bacterium]|jgi:opacity protein-like surface antigen
MQNKALLVIFTSFAAINANAQEITNDANPWEILLLGGIASLDADSTLIYASDIQTDKISQTNDDDWKSWSVQLGLGYTIPLSDDEYEAEDLTWFPSIQPQINLYYLQGNIDGYVDRFYQYEGNFSDTDYQSNFESTRLMFDLALTIAAYQNFSVFALAGVGPAWNRVSYDTGVNNEAQLHLNEQNQTNFAYEFGAGVSYALSEQLSITGEYLFTGFTNVELGENGTEGHNIETHVETEDFDLNAQTLLLGLRFGF